MNSGLGAIDNFSENEWAKYDLRYIFEVYDVTPGYEDLDTPVKERLVQTFDQYQPTKFELRLIPNRNYKFVVWADFVAQGSDEACRQAYCHHFIQSLPQGYDTVVSDDTATLSGGQKQLLTIARALLADKPLLILDEATSNVDTRTEVMIQKAMDKLMEGKTCFVIAHRLSTIVDSDTILVLDHGHIVEQGTHRQLLRKKGFYEKLYRSQYAV